MRVLNKVLQRGVKFLQGLRSAHPPHFARSGYGNNQVLLHDMLLTNYIITTQVYYRLNHFVVNYIVDIVLIDIK